MMRELLKKEGLTDEQITVENDEIVEDENGFISYRYEHGFPYITHALVYPEKRNGWNWLRLFIKFKNEVKAQGHSAFIAEVIPQKEFFDRIIKMLGKDQPYATTENGRYYLVTLR